MGTAADLSAIFTLQDMQEPVQRSLGGGTCCVYSRPYPGKEGANEDAAGLLGLDNGQMVLAVADGAGGQPAGEKASAAALAALRETLVGELIEGRDLRDAILSGFESANRMVIDLGVGAGTTLTAVELVDQCLRTYHVGDSEVLLVGQRGKVKLHTVSHSPAGYGFAAGMLTAKEAIHHEERHLVNNLLGSEDMHIQIGPTRRMAPRDTLVVASDGLFDNLHLHEIAECVRKGPLSAAGERLADRCNQRMEDSDSSTPSKPDDLTFILYRPVSGGPGGESGRGSAGAPGPGDGTGFP